MNIFAKSLVAAGLALVWTGAGFAEERKPDIEHGKGLVETNCSKCHATGDTGDSALAKAPAFRDLSKRYPVDALEEAFAEGIVTGHEGMPEFEATPDQIADIIAYLASIQKQ